MNKIYIIYKDTITLKLHTKIVKTIVKGAKNQRSYLNKERSFNIILQKFCNSKKIRQNYKIIVYIIIVYVILR